MSSSSNTAKAVIPAFVIVLALIGFMVTSYWYYNQEITDVRKEIGRSKEELTPLIAAQAEKVALQEISIKALSDDLVKRSAKIEELEKNLAAEKDLNKKIASGIEDKVTSVRTTLDGATRKCSELEIQLKVLSQNDKDGRETLQRQITELKGQIAKIAQQMLILREEALARPEPTPTTPPPSYNGTNTNPPPPLPPTTILPATPVK